MAVGQDAVIITNTNHGRRIIIVAISHLLVLIQKLNRRGSLVTREEPWSCSCLEWLICAWIADELTYLHASKAGPSIVSNGVKTAYSWVSGRRIIIGAILQILVLIQKQSCRGRVTRDSWGVLELRLPRVALLHNCRCTKLNLWACKQGKVTICLNGVNTAHIWVNVSENDVRGIEMHACRCSMCAHATRHDCYQKSSCDCLSIRVHSSFLVIFYLSKVRLTPKKTGMAAMAAMAARAVQRSFELLNENALALSVCYV